MQAATAGGAGVVRTVQHLFNFVDGGTQTPESGQCTPALIARITRFQRDILRYPHPDGRVDPSGRTIKVLLASAAEKARTRRTAVQPTSPDTSWSHWASTTW
ncbi:hypothetical protein [Sphingomonas faeni]|uniref:hypothetical protein n=1 Tax=Sphingomonas faeni TaxID=185950 RepID=UPI00334F36E2